MKYFEMPGFALYALLAAVVGYLLGSVSFSVIASRLIAKDDVRNHGSGNAGFSNMMRNYGKLPSAVTLIGDFSKGVAAVLLGGYILSKLSPDLKILGEVIGSVSVFVGHVFPLFFGFRGGKGVLSTAGAVLIIDYRIFLILVAAFAVIALTLRIVSLASISTAVLLPILVFAFYRNDGGLKLLLIYSIIICLMVLITHRENIKRLLNGTEYRFKRKGKTE